MTTGMANIVRMHLRLTTATIIMIKIAITMITIDTLYSTITCDIASISCLITFRY